MVKKNHPYSSLIPDFTKYIWVHLSFIEQHNISLLLYSISCLQREFCAEENIEKNDTFDIFLSLKIALLLSPNYNITNQPKMHKNYS